jgi:hypothetical protein
MRRGKGNRVRRAVPFQEPWNRNSTDFGWRRALNAGDQSPVMIEGFSGCLATARNTVEERRFCAA